MEYEKERVALLTQFQIRRIDLRLYYTQKIVQTLALQPEIISYLENSQQIIQDLNVLKRLSVFNIGYRFSVIYLLNNEGKTLVSTNNSFVN